MKIKNVLVASVLFWGMLAGTNAYAQKVCCSSSSNKETSGCSPSSCRGAKTKFGEAKVITKLRGELIALKAKMEKSGKVAFSSRSYDIHGIVGKSDNESLQIIVREVKLVEKEFSQKTKHSFSSFALPQNKAKQIQYLNQRIRKLQQIEI